MLESPAREKKLSVRRLCVALALAVPALPAPAQVVLDGTMGAKGALSGPAYSIPASLGTQVGGNLFHSFTSFNLTSLQSATFSGPAGIGNVVTRVTGNAPSSIDGLLSCSIAGANFWFINPHGIAFGPNARLNVGGSFHASTASYLKLGSSGRFDAANPSASVLTVDAPSAFGFLGTPAPLTMSGRLAVPVGETLSLVGGPLTLSGSTSFARLDAPGGRINLAAVSAPGEVTLGAGGIGMAASSALITLSAAIVSTENLNAAAGPIFIRGGQLTMDTAALTTKNQTPGPGSDIDIALDGDFAMTGSLVRTSASRGGDAGDLTLRAANVSLAGGSIIETSSLDIANVLGGRAGSVNIDATGNVSLSGSDTTITSISFFGPAAGEVHVRADSLSLSDGARINVATFGDGPAGKVVLEVGDLSLTSGGNVLAGTLFDSRVVPGSGAGGDIVVNAGGGVTISGAGSGLFSVTETSGSGGTINITADGVRVADGGRISTASVDPTGGGAVIGNAGSINITAAHSIVLENDGAITTESGTAGGGIINLHAHDAVALTSSRITTSVADGSGNGGDINIDPVFVSLNSSQIIARAVGGNGGDITIVTQFLLMSPDSVIDASSQFGLSGRVLVTAPQLDVASRLGVLNSAYVDPAARLRDSCAARAGAGNSLVGVGRGGLPDSPQAAAFAGYLPVAMPQLGLALPAAATRLCRG